MAPLELMSMSAQMGEDGSSQVIQEMEARRLLGLLNTEEPKEGEDAKRNR